VNISLWGIVQGIIITGLLIFGAMVLSRFVQNRLENAKALNPSMRMLTTKLTKIAFLAIAVVFGMQAVGIDLTAFAVFSGALGLGVGLGMQRTVSNLVAGFTMLADRSIKPGDVIEITTGSGPTYGEVKSLGARYVSVLSRSGTETLIPNEILIANPVTNWSFTTRMVRRGIPVGVAYSTDVELAQQLCIEAAMTCERVLKDPPVACQISGFGASSVDFDLRFWIADPEVGVANVESDVYLAVWKSFRANGIEIPFPQQDLHLRSVDPSIKMSRMVAE
jgi:small-conductance mechanosensitive channel